MKKNKLKLHAWGLYNKTKDNLFNTIFQTRKLARLARLKHEKIVKLELKEVA